MGISSEDEPRWFGWVLAALAFVLTPIGAAVSHSSTQALLGYLAANAVWVLVGVSRRQGRAAAKRNAELVEQQQAAREREARVSALELREAVARDIHDVLAHSLGGLVIQLDAAEALLESGRDDEARMKVGQARRLAAEGLEDARRAVATLRSPEEAGAAEQTANDLAGAAQRLLRAHRELGGTVDADIELSAIPGPLPASVAEAFERALQEALSNARRHAPGEPVAVELAGSRDELELTVSNALAGAERSSDVGGGHGLRGMAERFAALPGGSASARAIEGRFVVTARASLDEPPAGAAVAGPAPRTAGAR
jgi:signal transduction histidine kinase